jgi:hypothetical protein
VFIVAGRCSACPSRLKAGVPCGGFLWYPRMLVLLMQSSPIAATATRTIRIAARMRRSSCRHVRRAPLPHCTATPYYRTSRTNHGERSVSSDHGTRPGANARATLHPGLREHAQPRHCIVTPEGCRWTSRKSAGRNSPAPTRVRHARRYAADMRRWPSSPPGSKRRPGNASPNLCRPYAKAASTASTTRRGGLWGRRRRRRHPGSDIRGLLTIPPASKTLC